MKRRSVGGSRDRKIFRKTANRTRKRNLGVSVMRGGIRA